MSAERSTPSGLEWFLALATPLMCLVFGYMVGRGWVLS